VGKIFPHTPFEFSSIARLNEPPETRTRHRRLKKPLLYQMS